MTGADSNNLSKDKIQQLLAAVGRAPIEDQPQVEVAEYNWRQPHYFNKEQLKKISDFAEKVAAAAARRFAALACTSFDVAIVSITQLYAGELVNKSPDSQKSGYYLPFGAEANSVCGFINISGQAATTLSAQLLGDSESEKNPARELSQLEKSILLDIAGGLVEALSESSVKHDVRPAKDFAIGKCPLEFQGAEELCKIVFSVKKGEPGDRAEMCLLMPCCEMERAAETAPRVGKSSAENVSEMILWYVQQSPIAVSIQLASIMLSFKEIFDLQPDDILLLDKKIDDPIELVLGGRTFYHGRPAKSAGEYAMVITEPLYSTVRDTGPVPAVNR